MMARQRWLVAGASGLLGTRLVHQLQIAGHAIIAHHHSHTLAAHLLADQTTTSAITADLLGGSDACAKLIRKARPDVVVNCVGLTNVDQCENEPERATLTNATLALRLAEASAANGAKFIHISTDHLWRGDHAMVTEHTPLHPVNVYARSKAAGEKGVLAAMPRALILRTNFFGPGLSWRPTFNDWLSSQLAAGKPVNAFTDVFFTPIASDLLSQLIIELAPLPVHGVLHLAGGERLSKYDFAIRWARHSGRDESAVRESVLSASNLLAPRPLDMSLDCSRAAQILSRPLPSLSESLAAYDRYALIH